MKKLVIITLVIFAAAGLKAQEAAPAKPGVVYGAVSENGTPVDVNKIEGALQANKFNGKVQGKIVEVCQEMGCWAKLQKADGSTLMIKVKDHEFAMPKDIVGKTVIAEGEAELKQTSVKMLKHYAEDAGKSKEEIAAIKKPKKEITMTINGVKVVE